MESQPINSLETEWIEVIKAYWKKAWPWFQAALIFITIAIFGQMLFESWVENQALLNQFDHSLFLFATLVLSLSFSLLPLASKLTGTLFHVDLSMKKSFQSYFYSQAGKYLPGGIWAYIGRAYLFHKAGISKKTAFSITLMETLFLCISGAFCFLISVYFWKQIPGFILWLAVAVFFTFSFCALFPFLTSLSTPVLSRLGLKFDLSFQAKKLGLILFIYICFWEGLGFGFYYLTMATNPVSTNMVLILAGIYPLAWIMGKLVFFMPAGIGVREGALVYLLGFFLTSNQAIWLSVISRFWWIAAEALCMTMVFAWSFFLKNDV